MPIQSPIRLWKDRRGVVSVYFAAVVTVMVLAMVAALDLMRVAMLRSRAQAALDAAVLAAGRNLAAERKVWEEEAKAYFAANLGANTMGATITGPTATVQTLADGEYVKLDAGLTVPLLITAFTDTGAMGFDLSTQARKKVRANLEMVLAIDTTGSMADNGKMASAQSAARLAVREMLGLNSGGNIAVGLVPFNETVNVGVTATTLAWLDAAKPPRYDVASQWKGCLMERLDASGTYALDATPPDVRPFQAYGASRGWTTSDWVSTGGGKGKYVTTDHFEFLHGHPHLDGQEGCSPSPAKFLSSDLTALTAAIDAMTPKGSTMVASGLVWAWRMVSPAWRGAGRWGDTTMPKDKDRELNKVVVLLSDGDNAVWGYVDGYWYTSTNWRGQPVEVFNDDGKYYFFSPLGNARKVPAWGNLTGQNNTQADKLVWNTDDPAAIGHVPAVCRAMKADGIIIFTIPFGNSISTTTESLLRGCASDPSKYLRAKTDAELQAAFMTVVNTLSELVIVE